MSGVKELKTLDLDSEQKIARYLLCRVADKSNLHALCCIRARESNFIFKFFRDRILEKNMN